ncbi:hypothetical protein D9M69_568450 [compost metagenome]
MEVALRDEKHYLRPLDLQDEYKIETLYPTGFSAQAFVQVIESDDVWREVL